MSCFANELEDAMTKINRRFTLVAGLGFIAASALFAVHLSTAVAEEPSLKEAVGWDTQVVLKATLTADDQPLKLLQGGKPEITTAIVTVQPGGHSNIHSHPVPIVVYVLEGALEAHHADKVRNYKAGEALIEPINSLMQAFNPGSVPTKLLVVMIGEEGKPNGVAAK